MHSWAHTLHRHPTYWCIMVSNTISEMLNIVSLTGKHLLNSCTLGIIEVLSSAETRWSTVWSSLTDITAIDDFQILVSMEINGPGDFLPIEGATCPTLPWKYVPVWSSMFITESKMWSYSGWAVVRLRSASLSSLSIAWCSRLWPKGSPNGHPALSSQPGRISLP